MGSRPYLSDPSNEETDMMKRKWRVCPVCNGEGTTVNPAIDCNGLTAADFAEDPGFAEEYVRGTYDVTCGACGGRRVITDERVEELERNAEARRLAAREDGNYEAYCGAGDWRFG